MDTPESFAAELLEAAAKAPIVAHKSVQVGAFNIKRDARANVLRSAPTHNAHAAYAITYDDPILSGPAASAVVGYDKDINGGPLGNLLEYGGGGDHSPPHRDLGRALDAEEPRFEEALAAAIERLL